MDYNPAFKPIEFFNNEIFIKDFYVVSAIYSENVKAKRIIRQDSKVIFVFDNSGAALQIAAAYISNGTHPINFKKYVNSAAEVRSILREKMKGVINGNRKSY